MPHTVRPASSLDAGALAAIDSNVNANPWSEHQFAAACDAVYDNGQSAMVVEAGGRVRGFLVYSLVLDEVSIYSIGVAPNYQREGLGRLLLEAVLAESETMGATRCLLEVRESNTTAQRFYDAYGFTLDGVRKNYYPTKIGREDALLMSRDLVRKTI